MRDSLKHIFDQHIVLADGTEFYYTVKPFQMTNALGTVIDVLQEYVFTKKGNEKSPSSYKLYKTKEGNWYDIEEATNDEQKSVLRVLKVAIDAGRDTPVV